MSPRNVYQIRETLFDKLDSLGIKSTSEQKLFKNVNPLSIRQEKGFCLIFKRNIGHLRHKRALRAMIIASAERLKNLFMHAEVTQTLCIWTIHVPSEIYIAIAMPTIMGECTIHCNCSQFFHTCLQRNIGSCIDGEFHDG